MLPFVSLPYVFASHFLHFCPQAFDLFIVHSSRQIVIISLKEIIIRKNWERLKNVEWADFEEELGAGNRLNRMSSRISVLHFCSREFVSNVDFPFLYLIFFSLLLPDWSWSFAGFEYLQTIPYKSYLEPRFCVPLSCLNKSGILRLLNYSVFQQ